MNEPGISIGTIQGGQNNIGHTEIKGNQVQNVGTKDEASMEAFFEALRSAIPAPGAGPEAEEAAKAVNELENLARTGAVPATAAEGAEADQEPDSAFKRVVGPYINAIKPYGPAAARAILAFGEDYFSSIAQKNSLISATLKAIKAFRDTGN